MKTEHRNVFGVRIFRLDTDDLQTGLYPVNTGLMDTPFNLFDWNQMNPSQDRPNERPTRVLRGMSVTRQRRWIEWQRTIELTRVPKRNARGNQTGFWVFKDVDRMIGEFRHLLYPQPNRRRITSWGFRIDFTYIAGTVQLRGVVTEHDVGYRAEELLILGLYSPKNANQRRALAHILGYPTIKPFKEIPSRADIERMKS